MATFIEVVFRLLNDGEHCLREGIDSEEIEKRLVVVGVTVFMHYVGLTPCCGILMLPVPQGISYMRYAPDG